MTYEEIEFVKRCIDDDDMHCFYTWAKWLAVREEVLKQDKRECQDCKVAGRYSKATMVHHNNYVKRFPDLALEKDYIYNGETKRNLVSLCHECHEKRHGYRKKRYRKPITEERW